MLPYPNSAPPSPNPSNYLDSDDDEHDLKKRHKKAPLSSLTSSLPLPLRRLIGSTSPTLRIIWSQHKPVLIASLTFILVMLYLLSPKKEQGHPHLRWGSDTVENWGDHVGLGRARSGVLESTPSPYVDIGDKWVGGPMSGALYRSRRRRDEELGAGEEEEDKEKETKLKKRTEEFERDRHGIMGGGSVEWSAGVVGSGKWLGSEVDMRKESSIGDDYNGGREVEEQKERQALTDHILEWGWTYLDAEDQQNTEALLKESKEKGFFEALPLRDRVRHDEELRRKAAESWSRIYTVMEGQWKKSALEVQLEKMVRRVPVVVFSKTTCPHSKRAKDLLAKLHLLPEAHIVEVDLRPDGVNLKGLLTRRTNHSTFPNILIGSRSIGGADDLERLARSGELGKLLDQVGVEHAGGI